MAGAPGSPGIDAISHPPRGLAGELVAAETAAELELQYDAHGPRPADAIRRLEVPQRVRRAEWADGELDGWVRDSGIWYGRFRSHDGPGEPRAGQRPAANQRRVMTEAADDHWTEER